jgi:hypothetical protein
MVKWFGMSQKLILLISKVDESAVESSENAVKNMFDGFLCFRRL